MPKPRVLLLAELANPEWTSVPLEGWCHARALAEVADALVVTQVRSREAFLRAGLAEGRDFVAIDSEAVAKPLHHVSRLLRGGDSLGYTTGHAVGWPGYLYFEHLVWKAFGRRLAAGEFDVVHRLTPLSPIYPSPLARRCRRVGVPFVFGPINGGLPWPAGFDRVRRREREWLSYVRGAYRLLPGYRATRRHATALLVGSRAALDEMPRRYRAKCVYVPENAIDPARFQAVRCRRAGRPLRAVFVGRLVPYKGADMLLEAAAPLIAAGRLRVQIIGDGPEMPRLRARRTALGIEAGVELTGRVEHTQLQQRLIENDVFAFPSIREFGGAVVLEAMAVGLVPVVMDYGGPAELVSPDTGYTLPMGPRQQIVEGLRRLLGQLAADPAAVDARSPQAMRRARTLFTWEAKARQVAEVYQWVCGHRAAKPDFGMPLADSAPLVLSEGVSDTR